MFYWRFFRRLMLLLVVWFWTFTGSSLKIESRWPFISMDAVPLLQFTRLLISILIIVCKILLVLHWTKVEFIWDLCRLSSKCLLKHSFLCILILWDHLDDIDWNSPHSIFTVSFDFVFNRKNLLLIFLICTKIESFDGIQIDDFLMFFNFDFLSFKG